MTYQTQFPEWLYALGGRRVDMPTADRGFSVEHTITFPGNVTTATLAGTIKVSPDATVEEATWSIETPSFADGVTSWVVSLTGVQTAALPADANGDGVECFLYDFILTLSGGEPRRIMGGIFPLAGFVTEPA